MKKIIAYTFFLLTASCNNPNPYGCRIDQSILAKNDSIINEQNADYNVFLKKRREPKLQSLSNKSYRLIVTYSFDRDRWIYRLEQTSDGGILTLRKTYKAYYRDEQAIRDTVVSKKISHQQWNTIEKEFEASCFWTMPLTDNHIGLDGRYFFIEAFDPDAENPVERNYAAAARWEPEKGSGFRAICDVIENLDKTE